MRPLVALLLVALVAFAVGATIAYALGQAGASLLLAFFAVVAVGVAAAAIHDALERRRALRNLPVLSRVRPRRIRQGRP